MVTKAVKKTNGDRYVKKFKTWDHLISMLFVSLMDVLHYENFPEPC
ncbi:MAG: DUF4372 domain-containing protein [Bacteroidetes bacterium]|nr:DUF4372 domain-containing protein [Bacteroidota bacterium]